MSKSVNCPDGRAKDKILYKTQKLGEIIQAELAEITPCSEYDLLKRLREYPELSYLKVESTDFHGLFRNHFLLFHVLYQLREKYWENQTAHLEISPLNIQYLPYQAGQQDLTESDPLRDYYLDLTQLEKTNQHDVDEMLGRFWVSMQRNEHRDEALAILGLSDPVDDKSIRKTYQKMVMQHHPDRGGDDVKLQELNLAMDILLRK
jgi:hypothetical protein